MTEPNVMHFLHVSSEGWYYRKQTRHGIGGIIYVSVPGLNDSCVMHHTMRRATASLVLVRTVDAENFGLGRGTRYTKGEPN